MKLARLVCFFFLLPGTLVAQQVHFRLLNTGIGAAAMGMAGAFLPVADDATALSWNPAGLAQLPGPRGYAEFESVSGSESFDVSSSFYSPYTEEYSFSHTRPDYAAAAYPWKWGRMKAAAAFGWQRASWLSGSYDLKAPVRGSYSGVYSSFDFNNTYQQEFRGGEDVYTGAFSVMIPKGILLGFSYGRLAGNPRSLAAGHAESEGFGAVGDPFRTVSDFTVDAQGSLSGNIFKAAVLTDPRRRFVFGATVTFPYTRKSTQTRTAGMKTVTTTEDATYTSINKATETTDAEIGIPAEFSFGSAFHASASWLLAASITYAAYDHTCVTEPDDYCRTPYPVGRFLESQSSMVQLRIGAEYRPGARPFALRAGYVMDDQPYTNERRYDDPQNPGDAVFNAITLGAGYSWRHLRISGAYVRETGSVVFVSQSGGHIDRDSIRTEGSFRYNRLLVGVDLY